MPLDSTHPTCIRIDDDAILWRYMDLKKYISLLEKQALFFCRADKFSDPFECSIPTLEANFRGSEKNFRLLERAFGREQENRPFDAEVHKKKSRDMANLHMRVKTATTINCWHINNDESDAMWQLYLKSNEGVAIKTTALKLKQSLKKTREKLFLSKVRYINYDTDVWYHPTQFPIEGYNIFSPIVHKRTAFGHENELRVFHSDTTREADGYWKYDEKGNFIPVDIKMLIEAVVFHPTANGVVQNRIVEITKNYGFEFTFQLSRLSQEPIF